MLNNSIDKAKDLLLKGDSGQDETPVEYCRRKQEECLDRGDEKGALAYYEMAKMWMQREKKDE